MLLLPSIVERYHTLGSAACILTKKSYASRVAIKTANAKVKTCFLLAGAILRHVEILSVCQCYCNCERGVQECNGSFLRFKKFQISHFRYVLSQQTKMRPNSSSCLSIFSCRCKRSVIAIRSFAKHTVR
jgi:hypothetical protein